MPRTMTFFNVYSKFYYPLQHYQDVFKSSLFKYTVLKDCWSVLNWLLSNGFRPPKMSSNYSANQYESAYKSTKLQNWTVPKHFKGCSSLEKPLGFGSGHTAFIATDRGHLLPGVKRGSAWPSFQGTWDLPNRIPPVHINSTARSLDGQIRLRTWGQSKRLAQSATDRPCGDHGDTRATSRTPCDENTEVDQQHEEPQIPASSTAVECQEIVPDCN